MWIVLSILRALLFPCQAAVAALFNNTQPTATAHHQTIKIIIFFPIQTVKQTLFHSALYVVRFHYCYYHHHRHHCLSVIKEERNYCFPLRQRRRRWKSLIIIAAAWRRWIMKKDEQKGWYAFIIFVSLSLVSAGAVILHFSHKCVVFLWNDKVL